MRAPRSKTIPTSPRLRKGLNADAMNATVRESFEILPDTRKGTVGIPMGDAAMSSYAMFSAHG